MSGTDAAQRVDAFYRALFRPGEDHLWTAADVDLSADGRTVHFTGQSFEGSLEEGPSAVICSLNLVDGRIHRVARGRLYCSSPDGRGAFVSTDHGGGERVTIVSATGEQLNLFSLEARVEALEWSPDGHNLMILGADLGADVSGAEGGYALRGALSGPTWLPEVASSDAQNLWRRLYRWSDGQSTPTTLTSPPVNVWEASWLGNDGFVIVASDHHSEGSWYGATLRVMDATGTERSRHHAADQIGLPAGSPDGNRWAAIEAFCSDRGIVCGSITLGTAEGARALDVGVEVTDIRWRDDRTIFFAGLREDQTVVGEIDVSSGEQREHWNSSELTISGWYPKAAPFPEGGACAIIEGYSRAPAIARLANGEAEVLADFAPSPSPQIPGSMTYHRWRGRDGLEIAGWLVLPDAELRGLPLLVDIHGGPVWAHRNRYAAVLRAGSAMVASGYALFLPNPRGSGGRGQTFARKVHRDMAGEDTHDYLAGIDSLVARGIVDPARIAVTGTSYGGFMSAWLVTQSDRFAAAVPISPVANWYSQHFATQIPAWDKAMLDGSPHQPGGQYFSRSPIFFAQGVKTPTLVLAGGRDKNTPTGQAVELYGALLEAGVETAIAIYPEDGHSLRGYPAYFNSAARIVDWCERHVRAGWPDNS